MTLKLIKKYLKQKLVLELLFKNHTSKLSRDLYKGKMGKHYLSKIFGDINRGSTFTFNQAKSLKIYSS